MAFRSFTPASRAETQRPALSLTIPARKGRYAPFLLLAAELVQQLGWRAGETVALQVGEGTDFGLIRIVPDECSQIALVPPTARGKRRRHRIFIGRMPCLGDTPTKCDPRFRVIASTLLVTVPEHARPHLLASAFVPLVGTTHRE